MRATNGPKTRAKRKAIKRKLEGAWGTKHTSYKIARQQLLKNTYFAFRDRRAKKGQFRGLWINRLNGSLKQLGYKYSIFIANMAKKNIKINRKMLSELAINNIELFNNVVKTIME